MHLYDLAIIRYRVFNLFQMYQNKIELKKDLQQIFELRPAFYFLTFFSNYLLVTFKLKFKICWPFNKEENIHCHTLVVTHTVTHIFNYYGIIFCNFSLVLNIFVHRSICLILIIVINAIRPVRKGSAIMGENAIDRYWTSWEIKEKKGD